MEAMTSKQRILATVRREDVDRVPVCFEGICHGVTRFLADELPDRADRVDRYLELGADAALAVPQPTLPAEALTGRQWTEHPPDEDVPVIGKEYVTPAGTLRQVVRYTPDYDVIVGAQHGNIGVRLFTDHNVPPSRSKTYLVEDPQHLPALAELLRVAGDDEQREYLGRIAEARAFCDARGVLLGGYSLGVGDVLFWMSGIEPVLVWAMTEPESFGEYARIVAEWNYANLERMIDAGTEYVVRRGWYETTDFWNPALFERFLLPPLEAEAELARQAGVTYAYCMNSGVDGLTGLLAGSGIDVLCNLDPMAAGTDVAMIKRALGGAMTLCGGVNSQHLIVSGTEAEVRAGVAEAVETLGAGGGFILAPGDSIIDTGPTAQRNFGVFLDAWKSLC